ncbi:MAG: hypothetical protein Q4B60_07770 [Erysipelotrichaceae bacterium]|nr:hypothetical protein [Erysipelotrichaceae bacterium]
MFDATYKEDYQLDRTSSKGNQMKWKNNNDWYKADYCGYEGLSEYIISRLLEKSDLHSEEYVDYELAKIKYGDVVFNGCHSKSFLLEGETIVTVERLFEQITGEKNMARYLVRFEEDKDRVKYLVDFVERYTNINDFGKYLVKILSIDALFLNDDRHLNNIAIIKKTDGNYRLCPIFDNGAGLLSDTRIDYPLNVDVYSLMDKVKPRTISFHSFDEQLEAAELLYGQQIHFSFTNGDIAKILEDVKDVYDKEIINRVYTVATSQKNRYSYLFNE